MKCENFGNHTISYRSLLLSTTVLNDIYVHTYTTQAGFSSISALQLMLAGGIDLENVSKAKLAAGQIFSIIDLVCM